MLSAPISVLGFGFWSANKNVEGIGRALECRPECSEIGLCGFWGRSWPLERSAMEMDVPCLVRVAYFSSAMVIVQVDRDCRGGDTATSSKCIGLELRT